MWWPLGKGNPGDLDLNGKINLKDVIILLQKFVNMNYSD